MENEMKLRLEDYKILIKNEAGKLSPFAKPDGTSLTYTYMRDVCNKLIEISTEMQKEYPDTKAEYSNE
jgi:hypothetical protein